MSADYMREKVRKIMSKWLEKFNKSNQLRIQKRIEKLKEEYNEFRLNYRDFPYERYQKAMDAREKEIEELERFGNPLSAKREVEDYAEESKRLKKLLGNIHYLTLNIDPSDQKSYANVMRLQGMTGTYECTDEEFKHRADQGLW
jgi:hypothetical protein